MPISLAMPPLSKRATPFVKMHGLGNDFVVLDARAARFRLDDRPAPPRSPTATPASAATSSSSSSRPGQAGADAFMRIRNPDGGEAEACGNATRCVAVCC